MKNPQDNAVAFLFIVADDIGELRDREFTRAGHATRFAEPGVLRKAVDGFDDSIGYAPRDAGVVLRDGVSQRRQVSDGICGIANAAHQARVSGACSGSALGFGCSRRFSLPGTMQTSRRRWYFVLSAPTVQPLMYIAGSDHGLVACLDAGACVF